MLGSADVGCLRAFCSLGNVKDNFLPLGQGLEALTCNSREVNENILAVLLPISLVKMRERSTVQ